MFISRIYFAFGLKLEAKLCESYLCLGDSYIFYCSNVDHSIVNEIWVDSDVILVFASTFYELWGISMEYMVCVA